MTTDALSVAAAEAGWLDGAASSEAEAVGPFRLIRVIGRGQNGAVYEAHDTRRDEVVALKILGPSDTQSDASLLRFVREADAIRRCLAHPHIVRIRDAGAHQGRLYIAMERLRGETLRARIARGPLPASVVIDLGLQVASGLAFAHEQGIVHRDVKPDNIFLLDDGTAKLMDFGAARVSGEQSLTQTGNVIGSPAYMAPEQVMGESADSRTDVWGLAATLFEACTGAKPFAGDTVASVMYSIMHKRPDWGAIPGPDLARVLEKGLAKKPSARHSSIRAFADDLRTLTGETKNGEVRAATNNVVTPPRRSARRAVLIAAGTVAALTSAALLCIAALRQPEAARRAVPPSEHPASPATAIPPPPAAAPVAATVRRAPTVAAPSPATARRPPRQQNQQGAFLVKKKTKPIQGASASMVSSPSVATPPLVRAPLSRSAASSAAKSKAPGAISTRAKNNQPTGRGPKSSLIYARVEAAPPPPRTTVSPYSPPPSAEPAAAEPQAPEPVAPPVEASPEESEPRAAAFDSSRKTFGRRLAAINERTKLSDRPPAPQVMPTPTLKGFSGVAFVRVQVDADGIVQQVALENSSGNSAADRLALRAVRAWEFQPAIRNQENVAETVIVAVEMN